MLEKFKLAGITFIISVHFEIDNTEYYLIFTMSIFKCKISVKMKMIPSH